MGKQLIWDQVGERLWYAGIEKVALYPFDIATKTYPKGYAWNGVTELNETPSGAESNAQYADNIKYADITGTETYAASISAFMSPEEFDKCDGAAEMIPGVTVYQQKRLPFGLAFVTKLGNDTENEDYGYEITLVYNGKAAPSEKPHQTINESLELGTLSWEISTTPEKIAGKKPSSRMTINSKKVDPVKLAAFESILWGSDLEEARLPLPAEVVTLLTSVAG